MPSYDKTSFLQSLMNSRIFLKDIETDDLEPDTKSMSFYLSLFIGKYIWEYESWGDFFNDMVECKKDPMHWAVSDNQDNVHKFEQEFQIVLFRAKGNLNRLDEIVIINLSKSLIRRV